jgi:hypothetical protein
MNKIIISLVIAVYIQFTAQAQDESYRGGTGDGFSSFFSGTTFGNPGSFQPYLGAAGDGYANDSLISFAQYAPVTMFAPFLGSIADGYAHDSLINFSQYLYISMFMPYGGGAADGWAGYPVFGLVLPVELLSFSGAADGNKHILSWQTATEQNTSHFDIERSANARQFEKTGSMPAAGNSATVKDYRFTDETPMTGNNFYRLKMTDTDGSFKYSNVILLRQLNDKTVIAVYPNPATATINITMAAVTNNRTVQATIHDVNGKLLKNVTWKQTTNTYQIDVQQLPPGVYTLRVSGSNRSTVWPFIKN